jgi:hypothetical protein
VAPVVLVSATCKVKGTLAPGCPNRGRKKTSQEIFDWFFMMTAVNLAI